MTEKKSLVIYHAQCADGFGAAWAAWKVLGDRAEYVSAKYGDPPPETAGREVFVLDFSYPRATLLAMKEKAASLEVLDHHKTAEEDLRGLPFARFDQAKSGAMLAWERFHPGAPAPDLVRYIQDKDLWTWKLPESEEAAVALASHPYDFAVWDGLTAERLRREGGAILRFQNQLVEEVLHAVRRERIAGYDVPAVNCPVLQSYVGNRLAPGEPFAAIWFERPDGSRRYSLRSAPPKGVDVAEIAKRFGGGGHAAAAGFTLKKGEALDR